MLKLNSKRVSNSVKQFGTRHCALTQIAGISRTVINYSKNQDNRQSIKSGQSLITFVLNAFNLCRFTANVNNT